MLFGNLLKPFARIINAGQPACHGPIIPEKLFSTTYSSPRFETQVVNNPLFTSSDSENSSPIENEAPALEVNSDSDVSSEPNIPASKKKPSRRNNDILAEDVLKNWDQPLLHRLRPNRAGGYDKNGHATNYAQCKLVKVNGKSSFKKINGKQDQTISSRRRKASNV